MMEIDFRRKVRTLFLGLLLVVFSTSFAVGQIVTGSISGVAEDQQHAMVSGAKVTAHQDGTSFERSTTSSDAGLFALTQLPVGTYTVTIEAAKFSKLKVSNVVVTVAHDTSLGVRTLTIGATEVVNVEGTAPLVESTTTQIATSFENKKVADLPIGSGSDMLALFVPGVAPTGDNDFSNTNGTGISSNGQRGRSNNFQIDGQQNNDNSVAGPSIFLGNQDLIGEFQVITNYSAEFGRNMGSVVNVITKGGTNNFHGTAFEYHSTNWGESFSNDEKSGVFGFCQPGEDPATTGCTVPERAKFIDNRWGLTFGGPIVKDKAWFFFSYMGEHVRTAGSPSSSGSIAGTLGLTPTPLGITQLQAAFPGNNFTNALATIGPFAIPAGNPQVELITSDVCTTAGGTFVPVSGSRGTCDRTILGFPIEFARVTRALSVTSVPFNDRELTGRVDIQLSAKDRFTARYIIQDTIFSNAAGRFAAGAIVDVPGRSQQIALDWTRSWTSRMVNSFRFNYSRAGFGFEGGVFPGCTQQDINSCPTGISFLSAPDLAFGMQNNLPQGRLVNNSQWQDNASWVHGRHTLKFGGEYTRQRSPNGFLPNILGTFTFANFSAAVSNNPTNVALTDGSMFFEFKEQDAAFYAQDEWRVKDNLTLIFGTRWEYFQQAINHLHEASVARQTGSDPIWNTTLPLDLTTVHAIDKDLNNWGPNVGFAWTPKIWKGLFGEGKTVIRGGFRIAYEPSFYNMFLNTRTAAPSVNAGFFPAASCSTPCLPADPTAAGVRAARLPDIPTGVAADPSCPAVTTGVNPGCRNETLVTDNFHNPYTEQWNIGIQRQINNKMAFEIRYVGNHDIGNFQTINANPALRGLRLQGFDGTGTCGPTGATFTCPNLLPSGVTIGCTDTTQPGGGAAGAERLDCNARNVRLRSNSAWSIYHGLQTRFDVSNWHGVTANFAYTWSHTIDNVSEIFSTFGGGSTVAGSQNPFDFDVSERANSGIDFRHIATLALIYELPWYKNQQGVMGHFFGGWQVNITHRYTSGQAWTPAQFSGENGACQNSFDNAFFGGADVCRPFLSNPNAPIGNQGLCTDRTLADCGLVDFNTGLPTTFADVRYILNENEAAHFFGTPYSNLGRNTERGDTINNTSFSLFKTTRITERVKLRFEFQAWNVLNRQFKGVPDPFFEDASTTGGGSFANTFFNPSGGATVNATQAGVGRRRLNFGVKIVF